jgi:hypothetical protein
MGERELSGAGGMVTEINQTVAAVGDEWAKTYLVNRVKYLQKQKTQASGELEASLAHEVQTKGAEGAAVSLLIAFANHGRIVDMKRVQHDKWGRNAVERLEDWIVQKGVQNFVHGFLQKRKLKTAPQNLVNQMAWGIFKARAGGKFRRKPWYAKSSAGAVTDLYNQVAVATADKAAEVTTNQFVDTAKNLRAYAKAKGR